MFMLTFIRVGRGPRVRGYETKLFLGIRSSITVMIIIRKNTFLQQLIYLSLVNSACFEFVSISDFLVFEACISCILVYSNLCLFLNVTFFSL